LAIFRCLPVAMVTGNLKLGTLIERLWSSQYLCQVWSVLKYFYSFIAENCWTCNTRLFNENSHFSQYAHAVKGKYQYSLSHFYIIQYIFNHYHTVYLSFISYSISFLNWIIQFTSSLQHTVNFFNLFIIQCILSYIIQYILSIYYISCVFQTSKQH
jgi:hypothetical protein